jgi:hypothetical protein
MCAGVDVMCAGVDGPQHMERRGNARMERQCMRAGAGARPRKTSARRACARPALTWCVLAADSRGGKRWAGSAAAGRRPAAPGAGGTRAWSGRYCAACACSACPLSSRPATHLGPSTCAETATAAHESCSSQRTADVCDLSFGGKPARTAASTTCGSCGPTAPRMQVHASLLRRTWGPQRAQRRRRRRTGAAVISGSVRRANTKGGRRDARAA